LRICQAIRAVKTEYPSDGIALRIPLDERCGLAGLPSYRDCLPSHHLRDHDTSPSTSINTIGRAGELLSDPSDEGTCAVVLRGRVDHQAAKLLCVVGNDKLDIEELRTFVHVADAGGISPAADRLGISKSMVSRRVTRIEDHLGVQLIARTTRGATLTEAGAAFRDYADRVCCELDVLRETMLPKGDLIGRLRISAPLSFVDTIFAPVVTDLAKRHPCLQIHASYSDHYVDLVAGGFDCGVRVGYLEDSTMIARKVGPIYGSLVASPDYLAQNGSPNTLQDLMDHEVLMHGSEAWPLMDGDRAVLIRPQGRFKADNINALMTAAIEGLGIARLPDGLSFEHLSNGTLVPVLERFPVQEAAMFVVRPQSQYASKKVRAFADMLKVFFDNNPIISKRFQEPPI
jgi:DNA-binding transcriptional LysR family regulator